MRCKSCGATPGKNWDVEWSGDYSLCPRCTELYEKGGTWQENGGGGGVEWWNVPGSGLGSYLVDLQQRKEEILVAFQLLAAEVLQ